MSAISVMKLNDMCNQVLESIPSGNGVKRLQHLLVLIRQHNGLPPNPMVNFLDEDDLWKNILSLSALDYSGQEQAISLIKKLLL